MEANQCNQKGIRLRDAKLNELGKVSLVEWLSGGERLVMLLGAPIAAGVVSGSALVFFGVFCALRYVGLKIDEAVH